MEFDFTKQLRRTSGRTKSDVANKLISMFLHELSRRVSLSLGLAVSDPSYHDDIVFTFGNRCNYDFTKWSENSRPLIHSKIEKLYRDCQKFATDEIEELVREITP